MPWYKTLTREVSSLVAALFGVRFFGGVGTSNGFDMMIGRERERDRLKSRDQQHDDFQRSKKTTLTTFTLEDGRPPTEREREREMRETTPLRCGRVRAWSICARVMM